MVNFNDNYQLERLSPDLRPSPVQAYRQEPAVGPSRWRVGVFARLQLPGGLLLVRKRSNQKWGFPGGRCGPGESLQESLLREVWEETGLHATSPRLEGFFEAVTRRRLFFLFSIILRYTHLGYAEPIDRKEIDSVGLFSPQSLPENLTYPTRCLQQRSIPVHIPPDGDCAPP